MGGLGSQGRAVLIPVTRLVQGGSLLSKRKGAACFSPLSPEPPRRAGAWATLWLGQRGVVAQTGGARTAVQTPAPPLPSCVPSGR